MENTYVNARQPVQVAGDGSTGLSFQDQPRFVSTDRSTDPNRSGGTVDAWQHEVPSSEVTVSNFEVSPQNLLPPSISSDGPGELHNEAAEIVGNAEPAISSSMDDLGIDEDLKTLQSLISQVDSNTQLDREIQFDNSYTAIKPLTEKVAPPQRLTTGSRSTRQSPKDQTPPQRPQPAPRTKRFPNTALTEKKESPAAAPPIKTVTESQTGTKPKIPVTASQRATVPARPPGKQPTVSVIENSDETAVNRQSQSAKVFADNTVPKENVINNNNKVAKAKHHGYTVSEGNMDGHGNILADDEKEALTHFQLHMQKGKLKEQREKYSESIVDFKEALRFQIIARGENHPDVAKTYGLLGRLYHKAGKHQEAVEELKKELEVYTFNGYNENYNATDLWQCHDILAQVYDSLRETKLEIEHYEMAIAILIASTSIPPERLPHMHNNVGNAYRNANKLNEARSHLEKAKEMMMVMHCAEPVEDMAKVNSSLGDVYNDLGMTEEAIRELEQCVEIRLKTRPGADGALLRGGTHQTLSTLYDRLGNTVKAKEHADLAKNGLQGLMGSKEDRENLLQGLAGMVKGHNATGVLGRLAAGLTASEDINKAQTYQAANDNKLAIEHYEKGIRSLQELPEDVKNSEELLSTLALCYNNVGNAYRKTNQFDLAEQRLRGALEIRRMLYADEPSEDTGSTLFNLGHLLQSIGGRQKTQEALDMHKECLEMYKKLSGPTNKHKTWIVSLYRGLGVGYERLSNSRKSIEMYEEAKALLTEPEDADELRAVCNNMGNSYESIGNFPKAEENIMQALNMAVIQAVDNPDTDIQNHIAAGHNNLGVLYQTWDKLDKALDHLKESLKIREKIKDVNMEAAYDVASSYHNIGNTLAKMGNLGEALEYYEKELKIRQDLKTDTTGVRVSMSQVYDKLGETAKAEALLTDNFQ